MNQTEDVAPVELPESSDRTSRYHFDSSPAQPETAESEEVRRRKKTLHEKFVKKLGRPDSIAEIKRRRPAEAEEAEGEGDEDEEEEEAPKKGKKGVASKKGQLTPMEKQYLEIKRQHLDTIIVFQVGYKFQFYGEDARVASKTLGLMCITGKMRYDNHPSEAHLTRFASASFPIARLPVHVKRLVQAGLKVGIVRQLETAALKAAGNNRNAPFVRKLTDVYTKGTYVDDLEGLQGPTPDGGAVGTGYLLCLTEANAKGSGNDEKVRIGIVAVQPATGSIIYDEFDDGFMRNEIETRLLHIAPCEYLIVGDLSSATDKMIKHLSGSKSNVFGEQARVERVERSKTMAAEAYSHITTFYADKLRTETDGNSAAKSAKLDQIHDLSSLVTICLSAMITHLTEYGLQHIFSLTANFEPFSARTHMLLNGNTLTSLEIYKNGTDYTEKGSLFWALDRTRTRFGKRLLRVWVGRPLLDMGLLETRLAAVAELKDAAHEPHVTRLTDLLGKTIRSDLEKILVRIYYGKAGRPELLGFLQSFHTIGQEFAHVKEPADAGFTSALLNDAVAQLPSVGTLLLEYLERISADAARADDKYSFFLEPAESEEITDCKMGIIAVEAELDALRPSLASTLGKKKIDFTTVSGIEYLVEVENAPAYTKRIPASWAKISATKKASRFHPPAVLKLLREREQHKEALAAACDAAFLALQAEIAAHYAPVRAAVHALATLDALLGLAAVAQQPGYVRPTFTTGPELALRGVRHPMAEQLAAGAYVPNDVTLGKAGAPHALLVTGPNMGGKSSFVRAVALAGIMAQCGSYVPADEARLGLLDAVYTRMGAQDNMLRGESTFMVEVGETAEILRGATERSLVILDELGRGTSTHDGVAIAEAVLRELVARGAKTLFITHYQDLARVAGGVEGLRNVHMRFVERGEEVSFLYEVGEGVAHRSYGLNVARLAGVPRPVLDVAAVKSAELEASVGRRKVGNLARFVHSLLDDKSESDTEAALERVVLGIEQL
ncbi:hypothetical protein EJ06DRAFT_525885 [Trichodelitschia bisporula]|uniref:MutS protein homolog 3 n=1 Tax=Trichodelitschia bisporula TaxID=703511 RepID=A0A6G1IBJ3_9PEZI|nr:hypothetical protein EJ06DRAFT_525885 [Trichodelitschia bisporula]